SPEPGRAAGGAHGVQACVGVCGGRPGHVAVLSSRGVLRRRRRGGDQGRVPQRRHRHRGSARPGGRSVCGPADRRKRPYDLRPVRRRGIRIAGDAQGPPESPAAEERGDARTTHSAHPRTRMSTPTVALIAPSMEILGGHAVQVRALAHGLQRDGYDVLFIPINPPCPPALRWLRGVRYARTPLNEALYVPTPLRPRGREVAHSFPASYWSFVRSPLPSMPAPRCSPPATSNPITGWRTRCGHSRGCGRATRRPP